MDRSNFNREHSPDASVIYPFRFTLEPLTLDSAAKYVIAESPLVLPPAMSDQDKVLLEQISHDAVRSNDGHPVRHVGPIFERLAHLFGNDLADGDLRLDTFGRQAKVEDWGFQPGTPEASEALIIESFPGTEAGQVRAAAVTAVRRIGAQGEGFDLEPPGPDGSESHFERFFDIYKRLAELSSAGVVITWPVAENPNTTSAPSEESGVADVVAVAREARADKGRITHPQARAWAQLFDLHYRMLLGCLSHFMRLDHDLYLDDPGARRCDRTARGLLLIWTFDEMRRLKKIATKLVQLPKDDPPGPLHAGPPFELPYTVNLPEGEPQRWRCPDNDPPGQIGLQHERDPKPEALTPPPVGTLSFESDIKGLFRESPDRTAMLAIAGFDLHRYEDVRDHADAIAARLEDGTMPCDGGWTPDRIATFRKWIEDGKQP